MDWWAFNLIVIWGESLESLAGQRKLVASHLRWVSSISAERRDSAKPWDFDNLTTVWLNLSLNWVSRNSKSSFRGSKKCQAQPESFLRSFNQFATGHGSLFLFKLWALTLAFASTSNKLGCARIRGIFGIIREKGWAALTQIPKLKIRLSTKNQVLFET